MVYLASVRRIDRNAGNSLRPAKVSVGFGPMEYPELLIKRLIVMLPRRVIAGVRAIPWNVIARPVYVDIALWRSVDGDHR